ncbi:hypothetical protein PSAC2689_70216 [Paraburkholderia sacchari]
MKSNHTKKCPCLLPCGSDWT